MHLMKLLTAALCVVALAANAACAQGVVYEGSSGAGGGKHVVFLAGDRLAVAIGFAIELAAFLFGDDAVGLRFFLVFLQFVFAFFKTRGFLVSQLA